MAKNVLNEPTSNFGSLTKLPLCRKNSKSAQSLLESERDVPRESDPNEVVNTQEDVANKNFILDKFLKGDELKENDESFIKPPVPRPRKKLPPSNGSKDRNAKSTNILNSIDNITDTYAENLPKGLSREDSDSSESSARTYNVTKTSTHNVRYRDKIAKTSIIEFNRASFKSRKISEHEVELAEFSDESDKVQTIEDILQESEIKSSDCENNTKITYENELKGKKGKAKRRNVTEIVEEPPSKYETILKIAVHYTDKLEKNFLVIHPVVKVYLVDYETGQFIKKTDCSRGAVYHLENKNLTYIMPVITQSYNLEEDRQYKPEWEESIIINEDFNYITNPTTKVILFFELLDFVGFSEAAVQSSVYSRGWHRIAWAFLKMNGADGTTNTGKKLRLQLYKPGKDVSHSCPAFEWWRGKRNKYPSTLYITVEGMTSPESVVETFRSKTPFEKEKTASIPDENKNPEIDDKSTKEDKEKVRGVPAQLERGGCQLPNTILANIDSGDEGCYVLKFSNTGMFLACATKIKNYYTLVLYMVPEFETYYKLPSHKELIYNISFSKDDSLMASSSSDGTVCIWNLEMWSFLQILPHPSFVYWCEISSDNTIATACYDMTVRIWNTNNNQSKMEYFLIEELGGHTGYVTSLCFNRTATILYSADAVGEVFVWKRDDRVWKHSKTIQVVELKGTLINQIMLDKKERKLTVHARDSVIRIIDVKYGSIMHWLEGALNIRVRTSCCATPCGTYVICGSDNGFVHVWHAHDEISVKTYNPYGHIPAKHIPIHAVDFSPVGNMIAFGHFGRTLPIRVYVYDPSKTDKFDVPEEEEPLENVTSSEKVEKDTSHDSEKDSEKDIDLRIILEKIDRIMK